MLRSKWRVLLIVCCVLIAAALGFRYFAQQTLQKQLLVDAQAALAAGDFSEAENLARRNIAAGGLANESRLIASEAAVGQGASERALAYLHPLLEGKDAAALTALGAAAHLYWEQGNLTEAERLLRRILQTSPDHSYATSRLAFLLTLTGRHWESGPLRLAMMRQDSFDYDDLLLWGNARALIQSDELKRLHQLAPQDPLGMLGTACVAARSNDQETARKLVPKIIAARPDLVEARVLQGYLLLDKDGVTAADIEGWNRDLPTGSDEHPDIWVIRGLWVKRTGNNAPAARCFWEAVRRSPNHQTGTYQLALVLHELKNPDAPWVSERAEALEELQRGLGILDTQRKDIASMQRVVELTEKLGRPWESWGWSRVALLVDPGLKWAEEARERAAKLTATSPPQVLSEFTPGQRLDLSTSPLPEWVQAAGKAKASQ